MRLLLFALMALLCSTVYAGDYSEGWQCRWKEGWRITIGDYFVPFPPFTPFPSLGHDRYKEGFAEGVLAGAEEFGNRFINGKSLMNLIQT